MRFKTGLTYPTEMVYPAADGHCCWRMGCRRRSVNMEGATTHSRLRAALT